MAWYALKTLLTAGIVVLVSEVAKQKAILGSLIASLPLVSVLGMLWLYGETQDSERLIKHSEGTFWYVIPSLPMFLFMPWLMRKGVGFYGSMLAGLALTIVLYLLTAWFLSRFGINL